MSSGEKLNLDTSVLFNYAYSNIPAVGEKDKGSQELLENPQFRCVIGQKAREELEACCGRRYDLYEDFIQWIGENPNESIYKYDPSERDIDSSKNDIDHVRFDIQSKLADENLRRTLSSIRRCRQDLIKIKQFLLQDLLDEIYDGVSRNRALIEELQGLGLDHDKDIIADAVEINREEGVNVLVSLDSDITKEEQTAVINDAIEQVEGCELLLTILKPDEI